LLKDNMKKYLVTGGTGFIGSALVKRLVCDGYGVRVLDNNSRGAAHRIEEVDGSIEFIQADIRDTEAVAKATEGVDAVCHLAYVNGTEYFYSKPDLVLDVAVRGMLNVIDACRQHGVGELILASSSEVYQTPAAVPTDEAVGLSIPDILNPRYSYGGGKILCELMAVNYGQKYFDRVVIFRPHNVYGPDMGSEHVIPQFALRMKALVEEAANPLPFPIQGNGKETRAFVYIDDFTDGLVRVIEQGEHLNIYHIGTCEERSIEEIAVEVARCFDRAIELVPGEAPAGATPRRCPDIGKLQALGFEPKTSLRNGIEKTVNWYKQTDVRQRDGGQVMELSK
jgi:nucleoside-diphosphate-sugar epimerase